MTWISHSGQIKSVIREVSFRYNVQARAICGPSKEQRIVRARRATALQLRKLGMSLSEIGKSIGGRHYSSVANLLKRYGSIEVDSAIDCRNMPADYSGEWAI